jgi:RNA 3'-phosphate cyclase
MIELDGNLGGGGLLRHALSLSLITQKPFKITNIRKQRPKPGLMTQHLKCVELAKLVSNSKSTNTHIGSLELEFFPSPINSSKDIELDIGTAGSCVLLLQSVFLPCLLSKKKFKFTINGGTDVPFSPGSDYFKNIYLNFFSEYAKINFEIKKRGYYPKGQGLVELTLKQTNQINKLELIERGELLAIKGVCHASSDLETISFCEKLNKAIEVLISDMNAPLSITNIYSNTKSSGSGLFLMAYFENLKIGVSMLGVNEHDIAKKSVSNLKNHISLGLGVDSEFADQIIPLLGLIKGRIVCDEITDHIRSSVYVTEKFFDIKIKINEKSGEISTL